MNLRTLGAGLLFLAASVSGAAIAQQSSKIPHIGFLRAESPDQLLDAFREGLRTLGYVDGENIAIDHVGRTAISIVCPRSQTNWYV